MDKNLEKSITRELKINMKGLGIPEGAANTFADKIIIDVKKSLKGKTIITENDLMRTIAREAKKYNSDLAYVYKNHDKII